MSVLDFNDRPTIVLVSLALYSLSHSKVDMVQAVLTPNLRLQRYNCEYQSVE